MKLPAPPCPVQRQPHLALPAQKTAAQPGVRAPTLSPGALNVQPLGGAAAFAAPRQGRSGRSTQHLHAANKLPRRRRPGNAGPNGGPDDPESAADRTHELFKVRAVELNVSLGGNQGGRDDRREGDERERRFLQMARIRGAKAPTDDVPATTDVLAAVSQASTVGALSPTLRDAVAEDRPDLGRLFVRVARTWLLSRHEVAAREPLGLAEVKRSLMQTTAGRAQPAAPTPPSERAAVTNLWLPIFLLSLSRPRSPRERQLAADRLSMIEKGLGGLSGTAR